jgi:hypothetical protein
VVRGVGTSAVTTTFSCTVATVMVTSTGTVAARARFTDFSMVANPESA